MNSYTVKVPSYSIGTDEVYNLIAGICCTYGQKAVVIGGKTAISKSREAINKSLEGSSIKILDWIVYGQESSFAAVDILLESSAVKDADMIFGVGGGKAIDTAKILAFKINKPFFTIPTIAATCAAVTSVAAVYTENHCFEALFDENHPAVHTFINTRIIMEAPAKYLWTGIGDSIAKYYESRLSARGRNLLHSNEMGVMISSMCADPLIRTAVKGYQDCLAGRSTEALRQVILNNIISTGFASIFLEPAYNSAIAHSITYGLVELPQVEEYHMHGEIVSYGVLVLLMLDGQSEELAKVYKFNKEMGLPTRLSDLDVKFEELDKAIAKALTTFDLEIMPYQVTAEMYREAILKLENYK